MTRLLVATGLWFVWLGFIVTGHASFTLAEWVALFFLALANVTYGVHIGRSG
jgi:hypothetical protein